MKYVTVHGEKISISELARRAGLKQSTVSMRLKAGWGPWRILTTPVIPLQDRHRFWKSKPAMNRFNWIVRNEALDRMNRRLLLAAAKRRDPAALEALRRIGLLSWRTKDQGVIL